MRTGPFFFSRRLSERGRLWFHGKLKLDFAHLDEPRSENEFAGADDSAGTHGTP